MTQATNDRSTVVRVPATAYAALTRLAAEDKTTIADALARAVDAYETQRFFDTCDAAYAALRADPSAWSDYQQEAETLAATTITDGLEDWPWYEDDSLMPPIPPTTKENQ